MDHPANSFKNRKFLRVQPARRQWSIKVICDLEQHLRGAIKKRRFDCRSLPLDTRPPIKSSKLAHRECPLRGFMDRIKIMPKRTGPDHPAASPGHGVTCCLQQRLRTRKCPRFAKVGLDQVAKTQDIDLVLNKSMGDIPRGGMVKKVRFRRCKPHRNRDTRCAACRSIVSTHL